MRKIFFCLFLVGTLCSCVPKIEDQHAIVIASGIGNKIYKYEYTVVTPPAGLPIRLFSNDKFFIGDTLKITLK